MNEKRHMAFSLTGSRGHRWNVLLYATGALLLLAGIGASRYAGQRADLQMRRDLVDRAAAIALAIDPGDVHPLSFSAEDLNRPEFLRLRDHLRAAAEAAGLRSLYTLALRNGQIVFGPSSRSPEEGPAPQPGTLYPMPTQQDFEIFRTGKPQIHGPEQNESGAFATASFPVIDPQTDETILVAAIDVEASAWRAAIFKAQSLPILGMLGLLSILAAGLLITRYTRRADHPHGARFHLETVLCAVFMLTLTLTVSFLLHQAEKKARDENFRTLARAQAAVFNEIFISFHSELLAAAHFFESSDRVTQDEFKKFEQKLELESPAKACFWIPEVPADRIQQFAATARECGLADFRIWQPDAQGKAVAATGRDRLYPIAYIQPESYGKRAFGYDLGADAVCRKAVQETVKTGLETATDPGKLAVLPDSPNEIFIFRLVATPRQKGLVALAVDIEQIVRNRFYKTGGDHIGLAITLYQLTAGEKPKRLVCSRPDCSETCRENEKYNLYEKTPLFAFGKTYSLLILPGQNWLADHPLTSGRNAAGIGMLFTVMLCSLVHMLVTRHVRLEQRVRKQTDELDCSRRQMESLFRAAPIGIGLITNRIFVEINDQFCAMTGYARTALIGHSSRMLYRSEAEFERIGREAYEQVTAAGCSSVETTWKCHDGTIIDVQLNHAQIDVTDPQKGFSFTALDISRRKREEKTLRTREEKFRTTLNSIGDAVISTDTAARITGMNSVAEALTGWNEKEALGQPLSAVFKIINEVTHKPIESPEHKILKKGKTVTLSEYTRLLCRDGREIPIADSGAPIRTESGEITGTVLVFRDQTKERAAQNELLASEQRYRQLFENMTTGFALHEMIYDEEGRPVNYRFLAANPAFEKLTGLKVEQITGKTVKNVLHGNEPQWIERYGEVVRTGVAVEFQEYSSELGRFFDIRAFRPEPGRFAVVFSDITQQKLIEKNLTERMNELERFNRAAIDREVRMVELKQQINALSIQLARPAPYPVAFVDQQPEASSAKNQRGFLTTLLKGFTSHEN